MTSSWRKELLNRIRGRYSVRQGMMLAVDSGDDAHRQATEYHEWIHSELTDNTAFGYFQSLLYHLAQEKLLDAELRQRCSQVFAASRLAAELVHEGLATYRALVWYCATERVEHGRQYIEQLPGQNKRGLELVFKLLRNPLEEPYSLQESPAVHALCVDLGLITLNSPILEHYCDIERLFDNSLPYILQDGPDERLLFLSKQVDRLRPVLESIRLDLEFVLTSYYTPLTLSDNAEHRQWADEILVELMEMASVRLRDAVPELPIISYHERTPQVNRLLESWDKVIQNRSDLRLSIPVERRSVTDERLLSIGFARLNPDRLQHELYELPGHEVAGLGDFFAYCQDHMVPGHIWFSLVSLQPADLGHDEVLSSHIGLLAVPLHSGPPTDNSPLWPQAVAVQCLLPFGQFQPSQQTVADANLIWYTNAYHRHLLHQNGVGLPGLTIIKYVSAHDLLQSQTTGHEWEEIVAGGVYAWNDQLLVALLSPAEFKFTLIQRLHRDHFRRELRARGISLSRGQQYRAGSEVLSDQTVARIALWGFVG